MWGNVLQGDEIVSQSTTAGSTRGDDTDDDNESIPEDDDSEVVSANIFFQSTAFFLYFLLSRSLYLSLISCYHSDCFTLYCCEMFRSEI